MKGLCSALFFSVVTSLVGLNLFAQDSTGNEKKVQPSATASGTSGVGNPPPPITDDMAAQGSGYFEEGIAFQPSPEYTYDPNNRRDPFRPYGQAQLNPIVPVDLSDDGKGSKGGGTTPPPPNLGTPLQNYDISQFKLLGIIWNVKNPKAVIKDPLNKQHILYKYTKIGRNNGFVADIREGGVIIVEPAIGDNGMPAAVTRSLDLKK